MDRIEKALHRHFAAQNENGHANGKPDVAAIASSSSSMLPQRNAAETLEHLPEAQPFATVNSVVVGSPADQAELKAGDEVLLFGAVNWLNHEKLGRVAREVQTHQGVSLKLRSPSLC